MTVRTLPSAIAGLDNLELGSAAQPGAEPGRLARRGWAMLWPKLLAIALILVVWQLVHGGPPGVDGLVNIAWLASGRKPDVSGGTTGALVQPRTGSCRPGRP